MKWYVSQQPPPNKEGLDSVDVVSDIARAAEADPGFFHLKAFDLPRQKKELVLDTAGVLELGRVFAKGYLTQR